MADRTNDPTADGDISQDPGKVLDMLEVRKRRQRPLAPPRTADAASQEQAQPPGASLHFRPLGYDRDRFFFFTSGGKQIREITAGKLGKKPELLTIAPLDWWEREFSTDSGFSGRAIEMAANYLIRSCYAKGVFSGDRRRGRGVWLDGRRDGARVVIHAGDRLYIDGTEIALIDADTADVYEQQAAIGISMDDPLTASECSLVADFFTSLAWESESYGPLMLGWIVVSIASGALEWRPHGLLTGPKGCGKSSILDVMVRLLGGFCLSVTGSTSSAGLRQSLASDALAVLFDEAEADSNTSAGVIASVLSLMRHSSANLDAKVVKGGADGKASATVVRSCFMLSAIRDPLEQAADKSRVTVFSLRGPSPASNAKWKAYGAPLACRIGSPDFARRFRGRVLSRIPDLLAGITVFSSVAAEVFGDPRMGDQIGAMLGGWWLVTRDGIPSPIQARAVIDAMNWADQQDLLAEASDEFACLRSILEAHIRVDGDKWRGDASIGELHRFVTSGSFVDAPGELTVREAERALAMYGLRSASGRLMVSNSNGMLARKVMAHTPWPTGWGKLLARLPGADKHPVVIKIGGHASRVTSVPVDT